MLLIQTLECLYSLSSLGERACNAIVHVHGVIDTLVSLITVEVTYINNFIINYTFVKIFYDNFLFGIHIIGTDIWSQSMYIDESY